ncbi:uncharacterized protein [Apostichopus japonicus]|uniref:uncharacterized protein isoform X3 n=1 Tax=Stichopus japonicus TaxID=307972 RepID=UPI003AB55D05
MTVGGELSLHDLVDLSLGTPEVVNYRGLRTLLLTIVDTLKLGDVKAQLKESEKIEILAGKDGEVSDRLSRVHSTTSSSEVLELEKKVSQLETKLDSLNQLPSNENLMHRVRSHDSTDSQAPVSEMWQLMQVQKKAQTNEEGISKLMSMVEHLMGEFQDLKKDVDGMKQQMEKFNSEISNLQEQMNSVDQNNSALMERLKKVEAASSNQDKMNELQKFMNDLNNKISSLPPIELIVTWPAMEDALKGIYKETTVSTVVSHNGMQTAPMTDTSKIQTMPTTHAYAQTMTPSPPGSRHSSRPSSAAHPSQEIQKILKNIGELSGKHNLLDDRVTGLEELVAQKANMADVEKMILDNAIPEDLQKMIEELKEGLEQLRENREKDSDVISGIKSRLLDLQAEVDKLNQTCIHMVEEHNAKQKHIDALYTFVDRLQENKADKEHVTMEIDVKADKRALENKISRNQFEGTVDEISRNLNSVMEKLSGHQSAWQQAVGEIKVDVENKLDRMELDPLKAYLDKRIKAANAKVIRKEPDMPEDAAGFRKQLIQKFHCISCDRPLDMAPQAPLASLPESKGLPGTRSGRPYTTFELEQIRAAQKRSQPGKSLNHHERALFEREAARQRKQDIVAYLVHFEKTKKDMPMVRNCMSIGLPCLPANRNITVSNQYQDVPEYFVTNRSCGGSHTLTYPHRRVTRITHLSNIVQTEDVATAIVNGKVETDVVGQDGHIYKARISPTQMDHLPTLAQPKIQSARSRSRLGSAHMRSQTAPSAMLDDPHANLTPRPSSSRHPSRPQSGRPTSARPQSGRHSRSPPNDATRAAGDGHPLTPNTSQEGGQRSITVITPPPSAIEEIAVELPSSSGPQDTTQNTT